MAQMSIMIGLVKKLFGIITGIISPLVLATPAFADEIQLCPTGSQFEALCKIQFSSIGGFIGKLIILLLIIAVIIAVFFLIYGGIKWITSGGDKTAVEGARNHIVAAIVGLLIALLAFFIVNFVMGLLGMQGINNLTIPSLVP